jgi:hypothetical protein
MAAVFTDFGCFGFFISRFDRFCPLAIASSVSAESRESLASVPHAANIPEHHARDNADTVK